MNFRKTLAALLAAFFLCCFSENMILAEVEMPGELYALSAVLMDGKTGRILYEKDGTTPRANASTTKVLTCILAIEHAPGDDYVLVSERAAAQPEVKLGISPGEQYYLEDLLYSLMLKSHNDTAVAIAEHIGGSVEGFAEMMNQKAKEIGCLDTHFVTPNGLDDEDEEGEHHTTAADLARIMRYAIKNKVFLHITETRDYSFSEISGKKHFSLHNANALFDLTDGVLSGKTGYTGKAGYCYVCACEKEDKCLIVALLGCGWPNNKTYKWKDTMKLLKYGEQAFHYKKLRKEINLPELPVQGGAPKSLDSSWEKMSEKIHVVDSDRNNEETILLRDDEKIGYKLELPEKLTAPVMKNQKIGKIIWYIGEEKWKEDPVAADETIEKISYFWCLRNVYEEYFSGI